ncbi:MAG: hypothetical protein INR68_02925 [Methylobacterium mesophilicum]|nr:hypothetical protein [Methylobacterium mesophilicum]
MADKPEASTPDRKVGRGKNDGTGAFAGTQSGGKNSGVTSAKPQVITSHEDASFKDNPKDPGKDR